GRAFDQFTRLRGRRRGGTGSLYRRKQRWELQFRRPYADVVDRHGVDSHAKPLRRSDGVGAGRRLAVDADIAVVVRLLRVQDGGERGGIEVARGEIGDFAGHFV